MARLLIKRLLLLLGLIFCARANATTWNVTPSSNLQSVINGASAGDTISFAAGTYNVGGSLTGKCGITYTGPAIPISQYTAGDGLTYWGYYGQTAILNGTFRGSNSGSMINFTNGGSWANPCTQPTVIQYLSFMNVGGIYMQASYTNVTFQYNNFGNIPGQGGPNPGSTGIYLDGGNQGSNTAQNFTNVLIQWNRIGDTNSCLSPTNAYADVTSPDGDGDAGGCNGTIINSTLNGVSYLHNNFLHVSEGTHINCPGGNNPGQGASPCEPSANGATTRNLTIEYNDFSQTHRMDWEEQPQTTSGVVAMYNTMHDKLNTPGFSFGWSFACCIVGSTAPPINVSSNVIAWNLPANGCSGTGPYNANGSCNSGSRYGYGIEAWGNNGVYDHNYLGTYWPAAQGITWGWDGAAPTLGLNSVSNNTICNGNQWAGQQYSGKEVSQSIPPPNQTGNNFTTAFCTAVTSVAPTMALSGSTVTFTDAGYNSGPQPLGNTGIWYTTDGSTPVAGTHGTYIANGGTLSISGTVTIKAVGMWGAQNQTTHYASGLAFVPSAVVTQSFSSGGVSTPTFTPTSEPFWPAPLSVSVSDATPGASIFCTTNGTTPTPSSPPYTGPFSLSTTTTIQCMATSTGLTNSAVGSGTYTATPPPLTGCYQHNTTANINALAVGGFQLQSVMCTYTGMADQLCSPTADVNGSVVTSWGSLSPSVVSVGNVGASGGCSGTNQGPGCVYGVSPGTGNTTVTVSQNGVPYTAGCGQWTWTITNSPPTLTGVSISLTGGGSSVTIGNPLQACATFLYTGGISDTMCSNSADAYGSTANTWFSSSGNATISTSGVVTGVTTGSAQISVKATNGSTTVGPSTPQTITINTPVTGSNVILSGPQKLSGAVIQ